MNLPEMLESWIKGVVETKTDNLYSSLNERIEALVKRCESLEKDNEALAKRVLELPHQPVVLNSVQQPGDLSFMAQRIKELEDKVDANDRRHSGNVEMLIRRVKELETEDIPSRIEDHLDQDAFRDRMTDLFGEYIDGDDASEKIKTLVEGFLDDEIDNLEVKIRRG